MPFSFCISETFPKRLRELRQSTVRIAPSLSLRVSSPRIVRTYPGRYARGIVPSPGARQRPARVRPDLLHGSVPQPARRENRAMRVSGVRARRDEDGARRVLHRAQGDRDVPRDRAIRTRVGTRRQRGAPPAALGDAQSAPGMESRHGEERRRAVRHAIQNRPREDPRGRTRVQAHRRRPQARATRRQEARGDGEDEDGGRAKKHGGHARCARGADGDAPGGAEQAQRRAHARQDQGKARG